MKAHGMHGSGPAMATSFAWISVLVKRADQVVKGREILKCSWEDTFGSLLLRFGDEMKAEKISHVVISKSEKFIDPCHKVPVDAPVTMFAYTLRLMKLPSRLQQGL